MSDITPTPEFEEEIRAAVAAPFARKEFIENLHTSILLKAAAKQRHSQQFYLRPAWVVIFVIAFLITTMLAIGPQRVIAAVRGLFGYVPGVGLVENSTGLRILARPASVTRDGITITITHAMVYEDHVELIYSINGTIEFYYSGNGVCGLNHPNNGFLTDGDAELGLPDGTIVHRDYTGKYQSQNTFAMKPVFAVAVPSNVTEMTMLLKCIPFTKLGTAPENWEVPFTLVNIPAGVVVGEPVVDVNVTSEPVMDVNVTPEPVVTEPAASKSMPLSPQVTFTLERVAQTDAGPIFYIRMHVANPDPSMVVVIPRSVYLIDSQGQKIQLMNNTMYSDDPSTVWEYMPNVRPADGTLTLFVEDAIAKYASEKVFTFDAGENPQPGETWELNREFDIAGYKVELQSARAVTFSDIEDNPEIWDPQGGPDYPEGSQGFDNGYQFTFLFDPSYRVQGLNVDIQSSTCGLTDVRPLAPSSSIFYTQLCRNGFPKGNVNIVVREISVLVKNVGQVTWLP